MSRPRKSKKTRKVTDPSFKRKGAFARFLSSQIDTEGNKILTEEIGKMTNVPTATKKS